MPRSPGVSSGDALIPFTRSAPCPICGGHRDLPRGRGIRCYGALSPDGRFAHCTREERAGLLRPSRRGDAFAHWLEGGCRCGLDHGATLLRASTPRHALRPASDVSQPWSVPDEDVEACHPYLIAGQVQFDVCRIWPHARTRYGGAKCFPRHRGDDGEWYFGQGARWRGRPDKPLYRQDEALDELRLGGSIFVVEGERDADAIWDAGCIGVCNPDGAGSFREHHAGILGAALKAGAPAAQITIVADDDPVGIKHARRIHTLLLAASPAGHEQTEIVLPPAGTHDIAHYFEQQAGGHYV